MAKKARLDEDDLDKDPIEEDAAPVEDSLDEPEEEPKPKGKNTTLTLVLCGLNVLAVAAFFYLLLLDYHKRQEWSYAVFMNELQIQGLPLKEEDEGPSGSRVTMAHQKLDGKQIAEVFNQRGGKGGSGEFWAVDEAYPNRIQARHLTPVILKDYFGSQGKEVATLEEEVQRLKARVPADIAQAASETVEALKGKDEAFKRLFVGKLLLPLAYNVFQVEAIDAKIKAAKGAELDALIDEAVQRRLLVDLLAPLEIYRPGDVNTLFIEKVGDLKNFKIDQLKELLQKRFDVAIADKFDGSVHLSKDWDGEKRLSWEKRDTIGFLLLTIANLQKPDPAQPGKFIPLYPDGPASSGAPNMLRAQTVLGLYEFAVAAQNLPMAWNVLEQRLIQSIHVDRQGFDIFVKDKDGKEQPNRNQAFIDKHENEIRRIKDLTIEIKKAEERRKDLREQNQTAQKIFEDRQEHLKTMTKKLIDARAKTAELVAEVRKYQRQLYEAQAELRDAADRNARLEKDIRAEENKARGVKTP